MPQTLLDRVFRTRSLGVASAFVRKRWQHRPGDLVIVTAVKPYARALDAAAVYGVRLRGAEGVTTPAVEFGVVRGALKDDWVQIFDAETLESVLPRALEGEVEARWRERLLADAVRESDRAVPQEDWHTRVRRAAGLWRGVLRSDRRRVVFGDAPGAGHLGHVPPTAVASADALPPHAKALFTYAARCAAKQAALDSLQDQWRAAKSATLATAPPGTLPHEVAADDVRKWDWIAQRFDPAALPTPKWAE